jgi:hypothetical protein
LTNTTQAIIIFTAHGWTLVNLTKEIGTDYENLYKMYFDRTASYQRNLFVFPFAGTQGLVNEIEELKKKIKELEDKLDSRGT